MPEPELEKLLGGFAADQLTSEERQKLFSAALQDQELFNALADEQGLKELLADPGVRRRLVEALRQPRRAGGDVPSDRGSGLRRLSSLGPAAPQRLDRARLHTAPKR